MPFLPRVRNHSWSLYTIFPKPRNANLTREFSIFRVGLSAKLRLSDASVCLSLRQFSSRELYGRPARLSFHSNYSTYYILPKRKKLRIVYNTALLAARSAACLWNKVWQAYSGERKVLEAMLTAIDLIARCESGCRPLRVDRGMGTNNIAVSDSCRTLPNILIFPCDVFWSRFSAFSIPSRTRAEER